MATKGLGIRQSEEEKAAKALGLPPKKKIKNQTDVLDVAGVTPIPLGKVSSISKKPAGSTKSKRSRFLFKGKSAGQMASDLGGPVRKKAKK